MWVEPDLNLPGGESLVRQLLARPALLPRPPTACTTRIGWNPDSFGYNWQLPQIYKRSGMDYFVTQKMHWNDTNTAPVPALLVGVARRLQGPHVFPNRLRPRERKPHAHLRRLRRIRHAQPRHHEHLDLYGIGDHGGGPTRTMLDQADNWIAAGQAVGGDVAFRLRNEAGTEGASALEANPSLTENRKGTITTVPKTSQTGGDVAFRLRNETGTNWALAPEANPSPAENRKGTITSVPKTSQTGGDVAFRLRNETGTKRGFSPGRQRPPSGDYAARNPEGIYGFHLAGHVSPTGGDVAFRLRKRSSSTKGL